LQTLQQPLRRICLRCSSRRQVRTKLQAIRLEHLRQQHKALALLCETPLQQLALLGHAGAAPSSEQLEVTLLDRTFTPQQAQLALFLARGRQQAQGIEAQVPCPCCAPLAARIRDGGDCKATQGRTTTEVIQIRRRQL